MPSQKLCEPTSTACGASRKRCISWRFEPCPCTSTSIASPAASKSSRSCVADRPAARAGRRQHEGAAAERARAARRRAPATASGVAGLVRLGERARHEDARVARRSRTGCRDAATRASSRPAGSVNQLRRSSSPSVAEVKIQALRRLRHLLAQRIADVERRLDQARLVRRAGRSSGLCPRAGRLAELAGELAPAAAARSARRTKSGAISLTVSSAAPARLQRVRRRARARPRKAVVAGALGPAQLEAGARRRASVPVGGQAQLARRVVAARPRAPATARGRAPAAGRPPSMSRAKSITCAGAERRAEELHAGLAELVRLVEDRHLDARQQLGHAAVAQRHVGEEQVVVDDDQVGRHRLAPRLHDVAGAVLGALAAEAVLARRGDERDHAAALVEPVELGQVAAARGLRPGLDLGQRAHRAAIGQVRVVARLAEPVQAEIARAALEQRHASPAA